MLLTFPSTPPGPIPLLLEGICILLAILMLAYDWLSKPGASWRQFSNRRLWARNPPLPESDGDSLATLVNDPSLESEQSTRQVPHFAFFCFSVPGLALGVAAAAVELHLVDKATRKWNVHDAKDIGLTLQLGVLTYR